MSTSRYVDSQFNIELDMTFSSSISPILYPRNEESRYWKMNPGHRPEWFARHVADYAKNRFCSQFIAHWPDQKDWGLAPHAWDYEPVFIFFESGKAQAWRDLKEECRIVKVFHSSGHYYTGWFTPGEFLPQTGLKPRIENGHLCLLVESGHHGYLAMVDVGKMPRLTRYVPNVRDLTDEVIDEWKHRSGNPFKIDVHLRDPWKLITDPQFK